jgi:hypothetical protein
MHLAFTCGSDDAGRVGFRAKLRLIDVETPKRLDVHLVADNYATHIHAKVLPIPSLTFGQPGLWRCGGDNHTSAQVSASPCSPPSARAGADLTLKALREMALVGKSRFQRDLGEWEGSIQQQLLGTADPRVQMPAMRRHSGCRAKGLAEMRPGHPRQLGKVIQLYRIAQMRFHVLGDTTDLPRRQAATRHPRIPCVAETKQFHAQGRGNAFAVQAIDAASLTIFAREQRCNLPDRLAGEHQTWGRECRPETPIPQSESCPLQIEGS